MHDPSDTWHDRIPRLRNRNVDNLSKTEEGNEKLLTYVYDRPAVTVPSFVANTRRSSACIAKGRTPKASILYERKKARIPQVLQRHTQCFPCYLTSEVGDLAVSLSHLPKHAKIAPS